MEIRASKFCLLNRVARAAPTMVLSNAGRFCGIDNN